MPLKSRWIVSLRGRKKRGRWIPFGSDAESPKEAPDVVEIALAEALTKATVAAQGSVVEALSRELTARREARARVVVLHPGRRRKGKP